MTLDYQLIAAFTDSDRNLRGNIAAIIRHDQALREADMVKIAEDLNQPATTFLWPADTLHHWHIRWFAPDAEIGLCGHGSLAAIAHLSNNESEVTLHYTGGTITGTKKNHGTSMDIDAITSYKKDTYDPVIVKGIGIPVLEYYENNNKSIVVVENEAAVRDMKPDFETLRHMTPFGIIVTAKGNEIDFVSRTLVPKVRQLEDHATGSSHAALTPFWAKKLNKTQLSAQQLSARGGAFQCELIDERVMLTGQTTLIGQGDYIL